MKLSEIKINPNNPRIIKDAQFEKLVNSIIEFPQMMRLRRIILDEDRVVLGGNMRFSAILEINKLGKQEVQARLEKVNKGSNMTMLEPIFKNVIPSDWIEQELNLSEDQKKEFIVKDNASFGEWDLEMLQDWDSDLLDDWGLSEIEVESEEERTENISGKKDDLTIEKGYTKTHFLVSIPVDNFLDIAPLIEQLKEFDFVEIEQTSN